MGCRAPTGLASRGQRHVDALGDECRGIAFGSEDLDAGVERTLRGRSGFVDSTARIGPVGLGQRAKNLTRQRDRRPVPEVFGLRAGQRIEIAGLLEGLTGSVDRGGQRLPRQSRGVRLINHPAIIATAQV